MTSHATSRPSADGSGGDDDGRDRGDAAGTAAEPTSTTSAASLHDLALEARARLEPATPSIPAPRTPGGVTPPAALVTRPDGGGRDLRAAVDALVEELGALERRPDAPVHRAFARIGELTAAGVPERGWSARDGLAVDDVVAAAARAGALHENAVALLARLDAADRPSSAAVVDAIATSLRVVRVVADLEVFARRV